MRRPWAAVSLLVLLAFAPGTRALRIRSLFGRGRQPAAASGTPSGTQLELADPPNAAATPLDAASLARQRAKDAALAAELACSEAAQLTAEAAALKEQLDSMRRASESAADASAADASDSLGSTATDADTRATTTLAEPDFLASEALAAALGAASSGAASVSASDASDAADASAAAVENTTISVISVAELSEEASSETVSEMMMEEASLRVVWAELGLGPQEAFPLDPIGDDAVDALRERVFGTDAFCVRRVETTPCGVLFRGSLRADASKVSALVQSRLAADPTLAAQTRLFLLSDPLPDERTDPPSWEEALALDALDGASFEAAPEPVFLALPTTLRPGAAALNMTSATLLPLLSQALSIAVCVGWAAYAFVGTDAVMGDGRIELERVLPIVQALLFTQLLHEAAHVATAAHYRLPLGMPYLIPSATLGLGGGHAPLAGFPPNRTVLYDVAIAGPLVGGAASALLLLVGLSLTSSASEVDVASFPRISSALLHSSLLGSLLVELACGVPSAAESASSYALHPFALAGLGGTLANALALLPIGRLDGGRAATAAYGRRAAAAIGALALLLLGIACFISEAPDVLTLWAALSVALFRQAEVPCVDEMSEVEPRRTGALTSLLALAALLLCPLPLPDGGGGGGFEELARVAAGDSQLW